VGRSGKSRIEPESDPGKQELEQGNQVELAKTSPNPKTIVQISFLHNGDVAMARN
jgi:hypothetical protein